VHVVAIDDDALTVMRAVAAQAISERYAHPVTVTETAEAESSGPGGLNPGALLRELRVILARHLRTLLPAFLNDVSTALFNLAGQAVSPAEQRRADVASRGYERARESVLHALERQILRSYGEFAGADSTQELAAAPELGAGAPSLVGSLDLGEMLAIEQVTEKVEKELHAHSFELEQRLATLLGRPLNRDSNPLATFNVCRVLCDGVLGRGAGPLIRRALSIAISGQLVDELKRLYIEMNGCLKHAGVQPTFKAQSGLHKRGADED
jgi:hypothetical protein